MTQAERERAEKAAEENYPKDLHFREECSDYKCGAIKSWQEGYLAGYEQAMKDSEKLKD